MTRQSLTNVAREGDAARRLVVERALDPRAWLEVDLDALVRNAAAMARRSGVPLLPMVKADAYGLGAVRVARALEAVEPWAYGVATVSEGRELRDAGVARRMLVFTPLLPEEFAAARAARLTPVLGDRRAIALWQEGGRDPWHLGVDTGMSRAGMRWDEVAALRASLDAHPPEGVCTHFHSAELDDGTRDAQEHRFAEAIAALGADGLVLHAENSPAVERRAPSRWSVARPGIFLYGVGFGGGAIEPEPVVALRARIVELRRVAAGETVSYDATYRAPSDRRVATLPLGYADGYRRALSNGGIALVGGAVAPVLGLVTMDMTMVDVTDIPCSVGDVATLIGRDGVGSLDVATVARAGALSPYELLTGLRARVS